MTPQEYKKAMVAWAKELAKWQLAHPDRDWKTELLSDVTTQDEGTGGDRPPRPPINP